MTEADQSPENHREPPPPPALLLHYIIPLLCKSGSDITGQPGKMNSVHFKLEQQKNAQRTNSIMLTTILI